MNPATDAFGKSIAEVRTQVARAVVGQTEAVDLMLCTLLAGGHALLEGVPGTGKTLLVRSLAASLSLGSNRIQFTPDLMPSDITGTNIFQMQKGSFETVKGPVFTELLLADEINRTPPKTQAALLEAMQERQVTLDGKRHELSPFFTVFATQNPIEFEGTYPLPEAQRDRFLLWIGMDYPSETEEDEILRRANQASPLEPPRPAMTSEEVAGAQRLVRAVHVDEPVLAYARKLVRATRRHDDIQLGAGPRAGVALLGASKAWAALSGRDFLTPDDLKRMSVPVLRHRLVLKAESEIEGVNAAEVLKEVCSAVEVPR